MNKLLFVDDCIRVSTYVGQIIPESTTRRRVQLTIPNVATGHYVYTTLSMEQWRAICVAVVRLGPDCEGPEVEQL